MRATPRRTTPGDREPRTFEALRPGDVLPSRAPTSLGPGPADRAPHLLPLCAVPAWPWESATGRAPAHPQRVPPLWARRISTRGAWQPGGLNLIEGLAGASPGRSSSSSSTTAWPANHLRNPFELDDTAPRQQARNLIDCGGWGWSRSTRPCSPGAAVLGAGRTPIILHHVRSVVALRHHDLVHADDDPPALGLAARRRRVEGAGRHRLQQRRSSPPCPSASDRPGYSEWNLLSGLAEGAGEPRAPGQALRAVPDAAHRRRVVPLRQRLAKIDPSATSTSTSTGPGPDLRVPRHRHVRRRRLTPRRGLDRGRPAWSPDGLVR